MPNAQHAVRLALAGVDLIAKVKEAKKVGQAMKASLGAPRAQTSACPGKLRKQFTVPVQLRLSKLTRR